MDTELSTGTVIKIQSSSMSKVIGQGHEIKDFCSNLSELAYGVTSCDIITLHDISGAKGLCNARHAVHKHWGIFIITVFLFISYYIANKARDY